jgi:hypothetical protein
MSRKISHYEWLPDLPDHSDQFYGALAEIAGALPANVDLRLQSVISGQTASCSEYYT